MSTESESPPEPFEALLTSVLEGAHRFAYHLTRNEADAEDLLQEAAQQAFQKFYQFEPGTHFKAWLFRIIRNRHIDNLRRKRNEPAARDLRHSRPLQHESSDEPEHEEGTWSLSSRGAIDKPEIFYDLFGDEVNRFLLELPPEFRAALLLCDLDGFSYQEISEILDCPIGTVRSRISRARGHLKDKLYDYAKSLGYVRNSIA